MTLTANEQTRLEWLLWRAQQGAISPSEEAELRALVARQNPAAKDFPLAELVIAGLVIVGVLIFLHAISKD